MDKQDLIRNLESEYHGIAAANPEYSESLFDFLVSRGIDVEDIWDYSPSIGASGGGSPPDWL